MISNLFKSLRLTIAFCLFFSVFYIFVLWLFAQVAGPNKGNASHAGDGYDASSSAGSNKGPSNEEHLALLEEHIDTFLVHHPYLTREKVPAEIITASSSGLDPHISPKAAYAQAKRVADARGWSEEKVMGIVNSHVEKPLLGMFGTEKVNVLKLNVALDQASNNK